MNKERLIPARAKKQPFRNRLSLVSYRVSRLCAPPPRDDDEKFHPRWKRRWKRAIPSSTLPSPTAAQVGGKKELTSGTDIEIEISN